MSAGAGPEGWYYTAGETHVGPVLFDRLVELAREGTLNPRGDMVWGPGLEEWKRAGEVEGLFEKRERSEAQAAVVPVAGGVADVPGLGIDEVEPWHADREWPGVDRRSYLLAVLVVPVLAQIVLTVGLRVAGDALGETGQSIAALAISGLVLVISLWANLQRFPNLGMSRWWILGHFVPLLNLWVGFRCFACPPGYACFRKMDGAGWVLAIVYWLGVIVSLLALILLLTVLGSLLDDPERLRALMEKWVPGAGGGAAGK